MKKALLWIGIPAALVLFIITWTRPADPAIWKAKEIKVPTLDCKRHEILITAKICIKGEHIWLPRNDGLCYSLDVPSRY